MFRIQDSEKIRAGNKLGKLHVQFDNHKMRVKLAVQALSKSVADAIVFCREDLKLPEFQGSEGTTEFIYLIDKVFDILNSRSPTQRWQKSAMSRRNFESVSAVLNEFAETVLGMTYTESRHYKKTNSVVKTTKQLCQGSRKRAALGLIVSSQSILAIAKDLLYRLEDPFLYVLTYRFSQDLLELFFNTVRGKLGRNNNPTTLDFENIMKVIWHVNPLKSNNTGNCIAQTIENVLPGGLLKLQPCKKIQLVESAQELLDLDSIDLNAGLDSKYSDFTKNSIAYISGNVIRVVGTRINCEKCAEALLDDEADSLDDSVKRLIVRKDRGGLFVPCQTVYNIVEKTDRLFRKLVAETKGVMNISYLDTKIANKILNIFMNGELFPHAADHFMTFSIAEPSHLSKLVKDVVHHYCRIRLFDHGRRYELFKEISERHKRNKLTLFKNQ